jgi:AraC-like DNA-binding protein
MPASATLAVSTATPPVKFVSTDGIKVSDRRDFWESNTAPVFGRLDVELRGTQAFHASFEYTTVADLIFSRLKSHVPHRVIRTGSSARQDSRAFVKAVLLTGGGSVLEQDGRTTTLRAGEWSIYDTAKPYSVTIPDRAEMLLVLMPREKLLARTVDLQGLVARRFSGHRGLGKLIWGLISNTFDQIPDIQNRSGNDVADIVIQMTRLALMDFSGEHPALDSKAALRDRIKLYIANHLADPELTLAKLASVTSCTKRYLHMVFQAEGISISDYILKQRLERCRKDLLNPACAHRSITDIAYSWGFNNSNHFSRCFKQSFGASPRHLRSEFAPWLAGTSEEPLKLR